ncbi:restriction endonuclease [Halosimplex salinum]|uniref:restriction endonuclease n=1 Tax=Halosimplex salinum TaxID=1710538 RepID=UPI000F4A4C6E|nr:restriction endonuclease [Halosimplex salinum]
MKHVIEVEDGEESVLTETGSGGLIGRGILHDRPLAEYVDAGETPRYVVRNKKRGVRIDRSGDAVGGSGGGSVDESERVTPDSDHSATALVTDVRVLFAVGHADGDRTHSVPLGDVVEARTVDGFLGGALVLETVHGRQYRFQSRGDLGPVQEFLDAAAGVWTRAERHLEAAAETLDQVETAFEAGDVDIVLAAVGDVRETLADAEEAAASLDGASASVADRVADYRARLAWYERRAYAERAEQVRERAHTRWDDREYESAFDNFERAAESYAAALSVDADRPTDDLIERRLETLAEDRERLAAAPLERAEQAVEVASAEDDPETAVEWWERALDRYETLRSLDWGRDERRFAGDREAIRERLAVVAEGLVAARCERARRAVDVADGAPPEAAAAACERAQSALDAAREVARERVPEELDTVDELEATVDDHRPDLSADRSEDGGDATPAETVVVPSDEPDPEATAESGPGAAGTPTPADGGSTTESETTSDAVREDWASVDDDTDEAGTDGEGIDSGEAGDGWVSATRIRSAADESTSTADDPERAVTETESTVDSQMSGASGGGSADWAPADLASVSAGAYRDLVATLFRETGWAVDAPEGEAADEVDLHATTPGPVAVGVGVRAVHADGTAALDGDAVERVAAAVEDAAGLDAAVIVARARLSPPARERADERGVRVVGPDSLAAELDYHGVSHPDGG